MTDEFPKNWVRMDESWKLAKVIPVAGQAKGADTVIIVKSANAISFFNLDVQEILAKPLRKRL